MTSSVDSLLLYLKLYESQQILLQMQDDSSINNSARKSKIERSQSAMTDSFRMAASLLGAGSGSSKKALTLNVSNLQLREKDEYKKQPQCQVCFNIFGKFGQHHCRLCANAVCSNCSYNTINKQRACDICAYQYSDKEREKFKTDIIRNLTNLCAQYLGNKLQAEEQLKRLESQIPKQQERMQQKRANDQKMKRHNQRLQKIIKEKKNWQTQIESIRLS